MQISERLLMLRGKMDIYGLHAVIIPSGDPHLSEYPAEHWKVREWMSGFSGSAGTMVVTSEEAGLWTDSRYYLQAEEQLDDNHIQLFRDGEQDVPDIATWLSEVLMPGNKVGVNGANLSLTKMRELSRQLRTSRLQLETNFSPAEEIWDTRPQIPDDTVFSHAPEWSGLKRGEKIRKVRKAMRSEGISHYITGTLDEIAWALNIRGVDIPYNTVFHSYMIITQDQIRLFINPHKLTAQIARELTTDDVKVYMYSDFYQHLEELPDDAQVLTDPARINSAIFAALPSKATKKESLSFITRIKALKTEAEISNIRKTMVMDGIAMVKFLKWLDGSIEKEQITEISAALKLKAFRSENHDFYCESFAAISAYESHGAVVHYNANKETNATLRANGLYLIDSGGQYPGGTTDITRTLALGPVSDQVRMDYTLVLKGHIGLATAVFPKGTRGVHLDILARKALWNYGLNYGHGTGHGIGYFLNVHEGPQSIRPQDNGIELESGMVTSNEPGIYRNGEYGIRIENLIHCTTAMETEFGSFLKFETLTLCPLDTTLIKKELLSDDEILWLNQYHLKVFDLLSPMLDGDHSAWLKEKTLPI
jgi:Xaa-Pro aminopeptidase